MIVGEVVVDGSDKCGVCSSGSGSGSGSIMDDLVYECERFVVVTVASTNLAICKPIMHTGTSQRCLG